MHHSGIAYCVQKKQFCNQQTATSESGRAGTKVPTLVAQQRNQSFTFTFVVQKSGNFSPQRHVTAKKNNGDCFPMDQSDLINAFMYAAFSELRIEWGLPEAWRALIVVCHEDDIIGPPEMVVVVELVVIGSFVCHHGDVHSACSDTSCGRDYWGRKRRKIASHRRSRRERRKKKV